MQRGREHKTKPAREKGVIRQRRRGDDQDEESASGGSAGWSSALDPELYGGKERARKGRERKLKKSGRNQAEEKEVSDAYLPADSLPGGLSLVARSELDPSCPSTQKQTEEMFVSWEHLLGLREALKSRMDAIAAVHGWGAASANQALLGGIEPRTLLHSIQEEIEALKPASELLDTASGQCLAAADLRTSALIACADGELLNTASGATWVSIHHGGGVGIGYSQHSGVVIMADGTDDAARRIERVLWNDPGTGVMRHADAGYDIAIECARENGLNLPMIGN